MAAEQKAAENEQVALKDFFIKDELCEKWLRGCCEKTDCRFAHGNHEVKGAVLHFSRPYKTKKCKEFRKSKVCPNGAACWFLHDEAKNAKCKLDSVCGICYGDLGSHCPFRHYDGYYWY